MLAVAQDFDYVYKQLVINSPATSKFCFADAAAAVSVLRCRETDMGIGLNSL